MMTTIWAPRAICVLSTTCAKRDPSATCAKRDLSAEHNLHKCDSSAEINLRQT